MKANESRKTAEVKSIKAGSSHGEKQFGQNRGNGIMGSRHGKEASCVTARRKRAQQNNKELSMKHHRVTNEKRLREPGSKLERLENERRSAG